MPWYWTDDLARVLVSNGNLDEAAAAPLIALPVAYRSDHDSIENAARDLMDDGEIPLAA
jgi:hypothetical protein